MKPVQLGLLGSGIGHSLSPALHRAYLHQAGLHGDYQLYDVVDEFAAGQVIAALQRGTLTGLNVTTPFKGLAARLVGAKALAVNTLYWQGATLQGISTDGAGMLEALAPYRLSVAGAQLVVLGSGGAAAACALSLCQAGAHVTLCGRNALTTEHIAGTIACAVAAWGDPTPCETAHIVVHASRFGHGCAGLPSETATWRWLPWDQMRAQATLVVDIVYTADGQLTWFEALASGRQANVAIGFGRQMLAAQAAASFALWCGFTPNWRQLLAELSVVSTAASEVERHPSAT